MYLQFLWAFVEGCPASRQVLTCPKPPFAFLANRRGRKKCKQSPKQSKGDLIYLRCLKTPNEPLNQFSLKHINCCLWRSCPQDTLGLDTIIITTKTTKWSLHWGFETDSVHPLPFVQKVDFISYSWARNSQLLFCFLRTNPVLIFVFVNKVWQLSWLPVAVIPGICSFLGVLGCV